MELFIRKHLPPCRRSVLKKTEKSNLIEITLSNCPPFLSFSLIHMVLFTNEKNIFCLKKNQTSALDCPTFN